MSHLSHSAAALTLLGLPGVGRKTARVALNRLGEGSLSPQRIIDALGRQNVSVDDVATATESAYRQLEVCRATGVTVLGIGDHSYPRRLATTDDPPAVLFLQSNNPHSLSKPSVAIIGTREPTPYGLESAIRIARHAVRRGFAVVSGLALGCDTAAHRGCLDEGGVTIAVLPSGVDRVSPASNRSLASEIVESGGALVSEYPPGVPPRRSAYVERDRIQSGLACGVIVIETDVTGGTMHTVGFARKQRRHIAAVAHRDRFAGHEKSRGNRMLIADGTACPVADSRDVDGFLDRVQSAPIPASLEEESTDAGLFGGSDAGDES